MADKDQGAELPQRIRGASRGGPLLPVSPVLSEELRRRMQAAVNAERAAVRDQQYAAEPAASDKRITRPVRQDDVTEWLGSAKPPPAATFEPVARPRTAVAPGPAARPEPKRSRRRAGMRLVVLSLAIAVIGSPTAVAAEHFSGSPESQAAVRAQAAAWIAGQVSPGVTVSCDAVMCAALRAHGVPAGHLVTLGPASPDPVPTVLVVETPAVRELFGDSLTLAWAPAVLASFGSGPGAITVRVVARHGAVAYQSLVNAGRAEAKASGAALLHDSRVTVSAAARSQLTAGQVDSRLLRALASLAGRYPIDIVRFGNIGPGVSADVPLRFADLAESGPPGGMGAAAYARAVWAVLARADARIRPARAVSGLVQGRDVLRVEFTAPSPLGKSGPGSS